MQNDLSNEIYNVLSGKSEIRYGATLQTIARYLNDGKEPSPTVEGEKQLKKQEKVIQ
jgi:hypothetical protein